MTSLRYYGLLLIAQSWQQEGLIGEIVHVRVFTRGELCLQGNRCLHFLPWGDIKRQGLSMRKEVLLCLCRSLRAQWRYLQAQMRVHHHGRRCGRLLPPAVLRRSHLDLLSDPQQGLIPVMIHDICLDDATALRASELIEVRKPIIFCQLICRGFVLSSKFYWVSRFWLNRVGTLRKASLSQRC